MPRGNPARKFAISVEPRIAAAVEAAAADEGMSVSAWLTEAARRALLIRDGLAAVAEWESEHGALTESEMIAARARIAGDAGSRASA